MDKKEEWETLRDIPEKLRGGLRSIRNKFLKAWPPIFVFLFLFCTIALLFGVNYILVVSVATVVFNSQRRKTHTIPQVFLVIVTQLVLTVVAHLATLNLPLCILLNMAVPFFLVLWKSSQFNQVGYFSYVMCFVFMQLMPRPFPQFCTQLLAMAYAMAVFAVALLLYDLKKKKTKDDSLAQKGLHLLAEAVGAMADGERKEETADSVFGVQQELYKGAYQSGGLTHLVSGEGKIHYMFALLFRRAVYFLRDPYRVRTYTEEPLRNFLRELATYMEKASNSSFRQEKDRETLLKEGETLLERAECRKIEIAVFAQNFLRLFLLILREIGQGKTKKLQRSWQLPEQRRPIRYFLSRLHLNAFEFRFAMRLSVVLTVSFVYNVAFPTEHSYWLALNAFILLRPMYEDSANRLKTRFLGTVVGCVIIHFFLLAVHGTGAHFLVGAIMSMGIYMEKPGSFSQAIFVTSFALMMTTLAIPQPVAIELRLLYVAASVALVFVVNRFFFPTSMRNQFQYNLQILFQMEHRYLHMLEQSLRKPVDYGNICDLQIQFHMVYDQLLQYLEKLSDEDKRFFQKLLSVCWMLLSDAEQMLFLINSRRVQTLNAAQMERYLDLTGYVLGEVQKAMNVRPSGHRENVSMAGYQPTMEGEPALSMLMERYAKQISRLYRMVLLRRRMTTKQHVA